MISGINSYSYYSKLFKNPIASYSGSSDANLIFGAGVTALYSSKINQIANKEVGALVKGLTANLKDLKASANNLYSYGKDSASNQKSTSNTNLNSAAGTSPAYSIQNASSANNLKAAIHSFADKINKTVSLINNNHYVSSNAVNLKNNIIGSIKADKKALSEIGIELDKDDNLTIDDKKLTAAIKADANKVKDAIAKKSGIADKIGKFTDEALYKPAFSYASSASDLKNSSYMSDIYNYMSTAQKQYLTKSIQQGLLFDQLL